MADRIVNLMVDDAGDGMRIDACLASFDGMPSRSACARLVGDGRVTVNGVFVRSKSEPVSMGDMLQVTIAIPEAPAEGEGPLRPAPIDLDVRFEDDYLLVLSKQAGLVCHPSPGHTDDTLANALVARCGYAHLGTLQGEDRPGIVHRLDRDTSGLMVAAKDDVTQRALQDLIRMRTLDRRYVTLVQGYVAPETGLVDVGIARSTRDRLRMAATDAPGSREAITTFTTLERFEAGPRDEGYSLLECHLYTGRTHQIRVHMAHIHHPVVGDPVYRAGDPRRNLGLDRQFLHSWHIEFDHPRTGETLCLADTLPADLAGVLDALADRSMGRTEAGERIVPALGPARA